MSKPTEKDHSFSHDIDDSVCMGLQPLPKVKIDQNSSSSGSPACKGKKLKTPCSPVESLAASGSDKVLGAEAHSPSTKRSPKKCVKSSPAAKISEQESKISEADSLPEVKAKTTSKRRGRVIASRYKESAKNRTVATPTKMSDASCISINQSKLFSTATSSTPVSARGKALEVSGRGRQKARVTSVDPAPQPRASATAAAATASDKPPLRIKKPDKAATIKVKPMRAEPLVKKQAGGERSDSATEHQLLYNQYLQWSYLCRLSEASIRSERQQLSLEARQLAGLVDAARQQAGHLERQLRAVSLHGEAARLAGRLEHVLTRVTEEAGPVRGELAELTAALEGGRSRLPLDHCRSADSEELAAAAGRCRRALDAMDAALDAPAGLLRPTASAAAALQEAVDAGRRHAVNSSELVRRLDSLALQEASLSLAAGGQTG